MGCGQGTRGVKAFPTQYDVRWMFGVREEKEGSSMADGRCSNCSQRAVTVTVSVSVTVTCEKA